LRLYQVFSAIIAAPAAKKIEVKACGLNVKKGSVVIRASGKERTLKRGCSELCSSVTHFSVDLLLIKKELVKHFNIGG